MIRCGVDNRNEEAKHVFKLTLTEFSWYGFVSNFIQIVLSSQRANMACEVTENKVVNSPNLPFIPPVFALFCFLFDRKPNLKQINSRI